MPAVLKYSVFLLLLLYAICETAGKSKPITCHAGTFAPGEPAVVNCNLQAVDNATGSDVHMVRYQPGAPKDDSGENVLVCSWMNLTQKHNCSVEIDGYTTNNDSHSGIAVKIPSVRDEFAGLYMCFLIPRNGTQAHACDLILRGRRATLQQTTPCEKTGGTNDKWIVGLIGVLITTLISMAAFALFGFFLQRLRAKGNDCRPEQALLELTDPCNQSQDDV